MEVHTEIISLPDINLTPVCMPGLQDFGGVLVSFLSVTFVTLGNCSITIPHGEKLSSGLINSKGRGEIQVPKLKTELLPALLIPQTHLQVEIFCLCGVMHVLSDFCYVTKASLLLCIPSVAWLLPGFSQGLSVGTSSVWSAVTASAFMRKMCGEGVDGDTAPFAQQSRGKEPLMGM